METLRLGSSGPYVKLIQSLLNRIGYNAGPVDGIFGNSTRRAVISFQTNNDLVPDGVVGPATWDYFMRFLRGYDVYTIRPGDTMYNLARRYYTTLNAILTANPGVNPNNLIVGQTIIIPYGIQVVFTDIDYTYTIMEIDIQGLKARYPFLEVGVAGKSVLGKNLYYIRLGRGPNEVFYNGSHHALEWITSPLLMKFIENFSNAYASGTNIRGYNVQDIWNRSSIYIIPMVNPDGVDLVLEGISPGNPYYEFVNRINTTGLPISRVWKANIRGVDLNLNYPAEWERERQDEIALGITGPAPANYGGPAPLSEPESMAVADFTRQHNFRLVIAYHTQGRVIYWQFMNYAPPEGLAIARIFSDLSGYAYSEGPSEASYAGYKDWFLQEYRRPGYTIEVGLGVNPLPISQLPGIYAENEAIMLQAALL
ncbi:gamma-D-glutamyl-{L}-meso-diaminopimelate peptidase I [Anaerobacterium chartisolvens]|uniref:Gamma-D-glutamyl-(L)-meso-diaminopimelate peptidase I n=1 Tax=Anaerobacterium chartisolvens TaxID=1297424 RepID=A0A369ATX5_9FIRM|nr:M14 family metallopeptidase [Anaerobacterium chartisolvens]RCX12535.1 gamma-D-glutamyl-{L}-meso-diaminopimelate peptidase I [Anaerobacterium chartisolvens]